MGTKYFNQDGLTVRFGTRVTDDDENVPAQSSTAGIDQEVSFQLNLVDLVTTDASGEAAGEFANSAFIPANSTVTSVQVILDTIATSGGSADLLIGAYTVDSATGLLVVVDADGFMTAAEGDILLLDGAQGDDVAATAGALIGVSVGANPIVVAAAFTTAAFTAGEVSVRIRYRSQG